MNKSITQATQNDKQISKSIKRFFTRFHISSALKAANAYKRKGTPVTEIFQYMFLLIFSNRSMYMSLLTGKHTPNFAKDTVYRFMKMVQINWMRFTTILASRIINNAILPLDSEDRANVLIIDDSMFERNRSNMMLSLESRESNDNRSLGELFLYFSDEMYDITWIQAFQMLLQMFRTMLSDNTELSDEKINELANAFMDALPALLKTKLQAA